MLVVIILEHFYIKRCTNEMVYYSAIQPRQPLTRFTAPLSAATPRLGSTVFRELLSLVCDCSNASDLISSVCWRPGQVMARAAYVGALGK